MNAAVFQAPSDKEMLRLQIIRLVAILWFSNEAEAATDPFERRLRLNEMQAAIQSARSDIEAMAEGLAIS